MKPSKILTHFTPVFKIYKEGVTTDGAVTILKENSDTNFDINKQVSFYKYLGYIVNLI